MVLEIHPCNTHSSTGHLPSLVLIQPHMAQQIILVSFSSNLRMEVLFHCLKFLQCSICHLPYTQHCRSSPRQMIVIAMLMMDTMHDLCGFYSVNQYDRNGLYGHLCGWLGY
jgi:hypothetical protein